MHGVLVLVRALETFLLVERAGDAVPSDTDLKTMRVEQDSTVLCAEIIA
jgi:hypothetical protein